MQIPANEDAAHMRDDIGLDKITGAFEYLGDAVTVTDVDDRLVFVNTAFEGLLGYSKAELVGQRVEKIVPSDSYEVTTDMVRDAINEKWEGEVLRLHKTGNIYPVHLTVTLMKDNGGEVVGRVAVVRNLVKKEDSSTISPIFIST